MIILYEFHSYSYDLSHTLQHNMAPLLSPKIASNRRKVFGEHQGYCTCKDIKTDFSLQTNQENNSTSTDSNELYLDCDDNLEDINESNKCDGEDNVNINSDKEHSLVHGCQDKIENVCEKSTNDSKCTVNVENTCHESKTPNSINSSENTSTCDEIQTGNEGKDKADCNQVPCLEEKVQEFHILFCKDCKKLKTKPSYIPGDMLMSKACYKFVWNKHFLTGFEGKVHSDWVLHVVNGFIAQSSILLVLL